MNQKELKELIDFLIERDIAEFELERGDVKVRVKRGVDASHATVTHHVAGVTPMATSMPVTHAHVSVPPVSAPPPQVPLAEEEELHMRKSPIRGTFYESPAPEAPPSVKPADTVQSRQLLCIVDAMKL